MAWDGESKNPRGEKGDVALLESKTSEVPKGSQAAPSSSFNFSVNLSVDTSLMWQCPSRQIDVSSGKEFALSSLRHFQFVRVLVDASCARSNAFQILSRSEISSMSISR